MHGYSQGSTSSCRRTGGRENVIWMGAWQTAASRQNEPRPGDARPQGRQLQAKRECGTAWSQFARAATLQRMCAVGEEEAPLQRLPADGVAPESGVPEATSRLQSGGGRPLDDATRSFFEMRLGHELHEVRVHTDERADAAAESVNAIAYTSGHDVVFRRGAFAPESTAGRRLLAHELTHVVQQSPGGSTIAPSRGVSSPHDPAEREAERVADAVVDGRSADIQHRAPPLLHRVPSYIVAATFLGNNVDGGVNPTMRTRLQAAEAAIQATFNALPTAEKVHFATGAPTTNHIDWAGITSVGGWRASTSSRHGSGSAVDLNYHANPYIATGTVTAPGGEEGPGVTAVDNARSRAIEVYDRAVNFMLNSGFDDASADVRGRQSGEGTATMHARFQRTSNALRDYLQFGGSGILVFDIDNNHKFVKRISTPPSQDKKPSNIKGVTTRSGQILKFYLKKLAFQTTRSSSTLKPISFLE